MCQGHVSPHRPQWSPNVILTQHLMAQHHENDASACLIACMCFPACLQPPLPPCCTCAQITTGSDVYSFGVLMWSLYTGQQPYVFEDNMVAPNKLFPKFPNADLPQYVSLAERCMQRKPHDRPAFSEISPCLQAILAGSDPSGNGSGGPPTAGPGPPRQGSPTLREAAALPSPFPTAASAAQQQPGVPLTGGSGPEEEGIDMASMSHCNSRCLLGSGLLSHLGTVRGAERHCFTPPVNCPSA